MSVIFLNKVPFIVLESNFYLKICFEFGKFFFTKVLDLEKPYNFYSLLKTQFYL